MLAAMRGRRQAASDSKHRLPSQSRSRGRLASVPRFSIDKTMAKAAKAAEADAAEVIAAVRAASEADRRQPIVWITSNAYFPPLREVGSADLYYSGSFWNPSYSWMAYAETFEECLEAANIYLGSPEYDNCLYCVDMRLWQFRDDLEAEEADSLDEEWQPAKVCDSCAESAVLADEAFCPSCKPLPAEPYAWPGGYPIGYLVDDGEFLCADCVNDPANPVHRHGQADGWRIEGYSILEEAEEGSDILCAHCGRILLAGQDD
jgi:hypothetical protein